MKIIIFFALVCVNFCWVDNSNDGQPTLVTPSSPTDEDKTLSQCNTRFINNPHQDNMCFKHALEAFPELLVAFDKLFCKYIRHEVNRKEEFYKGVKDAFIELLRCAGCGADTIAGTKDLLEKAGASEGSALGDFTRVFGGVLEAMGLSEMLASLLCIPIDVLVKLLGGSDDRLLGILSL